jgi:thiol-disulfide isomerase/thioredoxin
MLTKKYWLFGLLIILGIVALGGVLLLRDDNTSSQSFQITHTPHPSPLPITYIPPTLAPLPTLTPVTLIGEAVPQVALQDLATRDTFNLGDFRGKIVVLNFWATWCPPCIEELPVLQAFGQDIGPDVVVLAVTDPNNAQTPEQVEAFIRDHDLNTLRVGLDQHMGLHTRLAIVQLPTTLIINPEGIIVQYRLGALTANELETLVAKAQAPATP